MRLPASLLAVALSVALAAAEATALRAPVADEPPRVADRTRADPGPLTLDQAAERMRARYGARVVRAEETREGGEVIYRIKLLGADGRVFTVRVEARTGLVR